MICCECKQPITETPAAGMNLPNVTDGPVYWCSSCVPVIRLEEIIESIEAFINPPKERGEQ